MILEMKYHLARNEISNITDVMNVPYPEILFMWESLVKEKKKK